mgnify:CR=1 FL=1
MSLAAQRASLIEECSELASMLKELEAVADLNGSLPLPLRCAPLELGRLPKLMMEAMSSPAWVNCSLALLAMSQ